MQYLIIPKKQLGRTVKLSSLRQLAGLFAPPKAFWPNQQPFVCKKHDSQ